MKWMVPRLVGEARGAALALVWCTTMPRALPQILSFGAHVDEASKPLRAGQAAFLLGAAQWRDMTVCLA